ncbi:Hypothetical_protein [Hexamita inflata]|uniref:Hypothetical_protein n=1 Tax=Hexamita inflata TaxID=28002 RepID=A0AA86TRT9_9EUKA|nr:Hypothetical protein HINF_LOCUS13575 [Hexamita inflata]
MSSKYNQELQQLQLANATQLLQILNLRLRKSRLQISVNQLQFDSSKSISNRAQQLKLQIGNYSSLINNYMTIIENVKIKNATQYEQNQILKSANIQTASNLRSTQISLKQQLIQCKLNSTALIDCQTAPLFQFSPTNQYKQNRFAATNKLKITKLFSEKEPPKRKTVPIKEQIIQDNEGVKERIFVTEIQQ